MLRALPEQWQMVGGTWSLPPWWDTDSALTACEVCELLKHTLPRGHDVYGLRVCSPKVLR